MRKKVLVLLSRIPYPLDKGDKLRAYHQIRELSHKHSLILFALSDETPHPEAYNHLKTFACEVHFFKLNKFRIYLRLFANIFSVLPFQVAYFYHAAAQRKLRSIIQEFQPDILYCQLIRTALYALPFEGIKVLDYQDVFSKGLERRARLSPWYLKPLIKTEYQRVYKFEQKVFDWFSAKTIISHADRQHIPHPGKDSIHVVPNGVDMSYYHHTDPNHHQTIDILFTGNMAYPPNINGAEYLLKYIMPRVWQHLPNARVAIVGSSPPASLLRMQSEKVIISGWVDDIRSYYRQARVFVAPMQIGTGLQNKLLEAMAMQVACVTSPLANEALKATPGEEILIGNNPGEYTKQVLSLLQENTQRNQLARNGQKFVNQNFKWSAVCLQLENILLTAKPLTHP